ncbi:MAG: hypothetical protein CME62_04145 [Halobacteriovoraceae bacterium]|nr:hypothetical protein [Halobacteriovoraceae bacterium]|tara:strand:+ start:8175 stop:9887 length:1713 start_codon:yes stop_codon:yes gene_type:complete
MRLSCTALFLWLSLLPAWAQDWSENSELPGQERCFNSHGHRVCLRDGHRANILNLNQNTLRKYIIKGSAHALNYPVDISELQLPVKAMEKFFNADSNSALRRFIFKISKKFAPFKNFEDLFNWVGLHDYPKTTLEKGPNLIADMGELEEYPMGVSVKNFNHAQAMTFSCAACHSQDLFGTKVLGLSNRFPRANEVFILGQKALLASNSLLFQILIGPSADDMEIYKNSRHAIKFVGLKEPQTLGLDTSLAQVGLSLAKRADDSYATRSRFVRERKSPLAKVPADSKPAVWWNLKYKTKWLSDASIDSGNPVHTNFLWNEIGRGVDLKKLENWLEVNKKTIDELTAYVFNTKAPQFNDFFPEKIDIVKAKRGEKIFLNSCKGCHGIYEKGWGQENSHELDYEKLIATTKVWYHKKTIVKDVGTDPYRHQGMTYFYKDLNKLKISQSIGTRVVPKKGYVPPPLVGIWARWPYFHNNSAPTLYDVITPAKSRAKTYIAVPSQDKELDFDKQKNGYPSAEYIREPYKSDSEYFFNSNKKGMSNKGHETMLLDENGREKLSHQDKLDLIEFLQTL